MELLTCEPQMANLLAVKALPMTLVCGACEPTNMFFTLQLVPRGCQAARQETRKHGKVRSSVLSHDVPRCVWRVEDPTTSRHRAITSGMKNEKKKRLTRAPWERQKFANFPR